MPRFLTKHEALGWTREHGQRLNAGDAAAILYESPWDSAYQLWARKTGRIPAKEQTDAMKSGNITEPAIFAWYEQRTGLKGLSQTWCAYEDAGFIQAKADFWHPETKHLAEFKAPSRDDTKDHEIAKSGRAPYAYWLQCQHLMQCFDVPKMTLVSWRAADDFAIIEITRDDDFWAEVMLPAYMQFFARIQENAWPKPEGTETIEDEEWVMQARRYLEGRLMLREAEQQMDRAKAALTRMADIGAKTVKGAGVRATWTIYKERFEVVVKADSKDAMNQILAALEPLKGKQGVGEIKPRPFAPNLVLRITEDKSDGE